MCGNRKSGSANELALLYVALARAAGLQAFPMQVVNRDRAIFDPDLSFHLPARRLYRDCCRGRQRSLSRPGRSRCALTACCIGSTRGRRHSPSAPAGPAVLRMTPANNYMQAAEARVADLTIDADGNVTGTIRCRHERAGRAPLAPTGAQERSEEVKKQFNESVRADVPDGVQADFDHFLGLDDYEYEPDWHCAGQRQHRAPQPASASFCRASSWNPTPSTPLWPRTSATIPIDVHYPREEQDDVTYHLPPGYTVESAPQAANISWPDQCH